MTSTPEYSDLSYLPDKVKKYDRQIKIAVGAALVVGVVILERRRVDRIVRGFALLIEETETLSQAAVEDTMWRSFDEGVRYGLKLAKEGVVSVTTGAFDNFDKAGEYAFGAFDKAS